MGCEKRVLSGLGRVQLRLDADGGDICEGMIVRWEEIVCDRPMLLAEVAPALLVLGLAPGPEEEVVAKTPR